MERRHTRVPVRCLTAIGLLAALLTAAPASQAGIRDIAKKAKDKATSATGEKAPESEGQAGQDITFDENTVELTGSLIDKLLAGRKASAPAAAGLPPLVARRDANRKEYQELNDRHGGAIWDNNNERAKWKDCVSGELQAISGRKQQAEMQKMMADPRSSEKILKLTAAMNDAQLKGDQAEVARLQKQMLDMYASTHADTVAAEKTCAPEPAILPAAARVAVLDGEVAKIDDQIRATEDKAFKIEADATGLTRPQLHLAWERIGMYLARCGKHSSCLGYSLIELKALSERKDALKAALDG